MREFDDLDREFTVEFKNNCIQALKTANGVFWSKVLSGRKVSRTDYAKKAFGRFYPKRADEFSTLIDCFTGVCDDLNDEYRMVKSERELLMGLLAKTMWEMMDLFPEDILQETSSHLKKMLYIQIAEQLTMGRMMSKKELSERIRHGILNYQIRSVDIDVFVILPVRILNIHHRKAITDAARLFRMVDLYAKDLEDREHDLENETSTPVTVLFQDGMNPDVLREPIWKYIKRGFEEIRPEGTGEIERHVVENFYQMAEERYRVIRGEKRAAPRS